MRKPGKTGYRRLFRILSPLFLIVGASLLTERVNSVAAQAGGANWRLTGSLNHARREHTATLLRNGKVLVAGGFQYEAGMLSSAELYDPSTGKWTETGSLNAPRRNHRATLLFDGKVLITGGHRDPLTGRGTAETYDPATGTWSFTANLSVLHLGIHDAVLLSDGKVFIRVSDAFELYDPETRTWKYQHLSLPALRDAHATTVLGDGRILVTGGVNFDYSGDFVIDGTCELYGPGILPFALTGALQTRRYQHTATVLQTGQVLVLGGYTDAGPTVRVELYNPQTGTWHYTASLPESFGEPGTTTVLPNGKVLVTRSAYDSASRIYLYDPATEVWEPGGNATSIRRGFTATVLDNGLVLFVGGTIGPSHLGLAELYDPNLPPVETIVTVSAAAYDDTGLATEAVASAFGTDLANTTMTAASVPLPTELAGTTITVKDSPGIERLAPLFFVSPTQVNYQIPPGTARGTALVTLRTAGGKQAVAITFVERVAPGLFTANADGKGVAAALALRVKADGSQSYEEIARFDNGTNQFVTRALDLGPESEKVFLVLFGTGIRHLSSISSAAVRIGGINAEVVFAGAHSEFVGVDQVNVLLPRSLAGRGEVVVGLRVGIAGANPVGIQIK